MPKTRAQRRKRARTAAHGRRTRSAKPVKKYAILSRGRSLHSVRRLLQEAKKLRVACDVIHPLECQLVVDGKHSKILVGSEPIPRYEAILPRIGASITEYGLAVVKQFETLGTRAVNSAQAISDSRDKLRSLQILTEAGLDVPTTVLTRSQRGIRAALMAIQTMPAVLKLLRGTQGVGVMIVHSPLSMHSVLDTVRGLGEDALIQRFIAEGAGQDYRAFIVGNRVVAAMRRTAPPGEFRSNIHRGGEGTPVELTRPYARAALTAARVLGLEIAGVDLMEGPHGPLIIEVNSSPGFEGIEKTTGLNVAREIVLQMTRGK